MTFWLLLACCYVTGVVGYWPEVKQAGYGIARTLRRLL